MSCECFSLESSNRLNVICTFNENSLRCHYLLKSVIQKALSTKLFINMIIITLTPLTHLFGITSDFIPFKPILKLIKALSWLTKTNINC